MPGIEGNQKCICITRSFSRYRPGDVINRFISSSCVDRRAFPPTHKQNNHDPGLVKMWKNDGNLWSLVGPCITRPWRVFLVLPVVLLVVLYSGLSFLCITRYFWEVTPKMTSTYLVARRRMMRVSRSYDKKRHCPGVAKSQKKKHGLWGPSYYDLGMVLGLGVIHSCWMGPKCREFPFLSGKRTNRHVLER